MDPRSTTINHDLTITHPYINIRLTEKETATLGEIKRKISIMYQDRGLRGEVVDKLLYNGKVLPDEWTLTDLKEQYTVNAFKNLNLITAAKQEEKFWLCNPKDFAASFFVLGFITGVAGGIALGEEVNGWLGFALFVACVVVGYTIGAALDNNKCCGRNTAREFIPFLNRREQIGDAAPLISPGSRL
jgi:hypothetical protein